MIINLIISISIFSISAPYGIREATEKIESKASKKSSVLQEDAVHYPSTSRYNLHHLFYDLLKFSAKHLKMNGRLVFWYPVHKYIEF